MPGVYGFTRLASACRTPTAAHASRCNPAPELLKQRLGRAPVPFTSVAVNQQ